MGRRRLTDLFEPGSIDCTPYRPRHAAPPKLVRALLKTWLARFFLPPAPTRTRVTPAWSGAASLSSAWSPGAATLTSAWPPGAARGFGSAVHSNSPLRVTPASAGTGMFLCAGHDLIVPGRDMPLGLRSMWATTSTSIRSARRPR
jgi:hypothetical protein